MCANDRGRTRLSEGLCVLIITLSALSLRDRRRGPPPQVPGPRFYEVQAQPRTSNLFGARSSSRPPIPQDDPRIYDAPCGASLPTPEYYASPRRLRRRPVHYLRRYRKPWTFLSTDVPGRRRHALATRRRSNSRRKSAEQSQQLRFSTRESRLLVSVTAIWRYWIITTMPGLLFACETCGCR